MGNQNLLLAAKHGLNRNTHKRVASSAPVVIVRLPRRVTCAIWRGMTIQAAVRFWPRQPVALAASHAPGEVGGCGVQSNNYWSSTTYAGNTTNAWYVNLNDGNVNTNNKANTNYVWPVRGGE